MTKAEQIERDVATLKESISRDMKDWLGATTEQERTGIRTHLRFCVEELLWILGEMDKAENAPDLSQRAKSIVDQVTRGD